MEVTFHPKKLGKRSFLRCAKCRFIHFHSFAKFDRARLCQRESSFCHCRTLVGGFSVFHLKFEGPITSEYDPSIVQWNVWKDFLQFPDRSHLLHIRKIQLDSNIHVLHILKYSRRSAAGSARTKVTRCHKRKCRCRSRSNILRQIHPKTLYLAPFLCL